MKGQEKLFSKQSDEWQTPASLISLLADRGYTIRLDLASNGFNNVCSNYCTDFFNFDEKKEKFIFTSPRRASVAFCNPPYSNWQKFVEKISLMKIPVIMLLPSRTDTKAFHDYIYKKPDITIEFLRGRLKFSNSKNSAPFPSMLVYFRC